MLKNKKFLIIFFTIFILIFFSFSNCFAYTIDENNAVSSYALVKDYCESNNLTIYDYVITSEGFIYVAINSDYSLSVVYGEAAGKYANYITCTGYRIFKLEDNGNFSVAVSSTNGSKYTYGDAIIYSSFDVLKDGTIFFLKTPVVQGIIAPKLEGVEMSQTIQEIVAILPLIIVVVVSLVGLRKALQMLSTLLRKA